MAASAQELAQASFGTVLLGQWHVHPDGSIYYNNTRYSQATLPWVLSHVPGMLKANGKVQQVLLSFGPFGADFDAITTNLVAFKATVGQLLQQYQLDGLDFDIEGDYTSANLATLADLTNWAHSLGKIVMAAPYTETQWWQSLLKQTSNFNWWNLQLYGGADYGDWVQGLQGLTSNPQSFLTCGYKPANGLSPTEVTTALQDTRKQYAGLSGAFIWRYEDIRGQASAYAAAMIQGMS